MKELRASVIIPVRNGAATIGACLEALEQQSFDRSGYEILVVDDGSTDGTCGIVSKYAGVRLLTQPAHGPAAARNLGARQASGRILVFTDADCVPDSGWLAAMLAPFDDPEVMGVKGSYRTRQRGIIARFVQAEYEDKYDRLRQYPRIDFIDTYSAAYRRNLFLAEGGFDERFPSASVEDQEFSFRLARQGYLLVFAPAAFVYHQHAATLPGYARKKFRIGYWKVLVGLKHPDKLVTDTHTPQSLRVQIALCALMPVLLGLRVLGLRRAGNLLVLVAGAFGLSAAPFLVKIGCGNYGISVTILALPLLLVRAYALGTGFLVGLIQKRWR